MALTTTSDQSSSALTMHCDNVFGRLISRQAPSRVKRRRASAVPGVKEPAQEASPTRNSSNSSNSSNSAQPTAHNPQPTAHSPQPSTHNVPQVFGRQSPVASHQHNPGSAHAPTRRWVTAPACCVPGKARAQRRRIRPLRPLPQIRRRLEGRLRTPMSLAVRQQSKRARHANCQRLHSPDRLAASGL